MVMIVLNRKIMLAKIKNYLPSIKNYLYSKLWTFTFLLWVVVSVFMFCAGDAYTPQTSAQIQKLIHQHAQRFHLDPHLVQAVILVESSGKRTALSSKGAVGLMQLMPGTAQDLAKQLKLTGPLDLTDSNTNLMLGCYYLHQLEQRFHGDLVLVLAAYNTGPSRVASWIYHNPTISSTELIAQQGNRETKNFVARVLERYRTLLSQP